MGGRALFSQQLIEELLSFAHVQAVAARAGVSISSFDRDFGVDSTFRPITIIGNRRLVSGCALDFQLKSSTRCQVEAEHIVYDLEVKTYNDLVGRRLSSEATPCILILKVLSPNQDHWLESGEDGLFLPGACYWEYLQGNLSQNKESIRIRISREQQLSPAYLIKLLNCTREYNISGVWTC
jgi:hypothetical protein